MDELISKYIGRKFLVFTIATIAWLVFNKMGTTDWVIVSTLYIGTEGAVSIAKVIATGHPKTKEKKDEKTSEAL